MRHMVPTALLLAPMVALVLAAAPARPPAQRATAAAARAAAPKQVLPWIEDDFPRALARAKARKLPIFVESWAPW